MKYQGKLKDKLNDSLFEAILSLRNIDECYHFFEDICTVSELRSLAQRLEVAKMLEANRTYGDIATKTGASTATISRVKRCLNYGADGYKLVLRRLAEQSPMQNDKTKE
ncbi:YerC/YecD family TrpR-related protein [Desulfotomaculum defluvii]